MPMIDSVVRCINHPDETVLKETKLKALLSLEETQIQQAGLPIQVYRCPVCGYCELYYSDDAL